MVRPVSRALALISLPVLVLCGCSTLFWETGLPWTQAEFRVEGVTPRGPYLDVLVSSGSIERRFFSPRSDECLALLETEHTVTLGNTNGYGPFRRDDLECPIIGIGNLEDFRRSRSQGTGYGGSPIRRGNEDLRIVYRDEQYFYARSGFSIGAMLGWAPGTDQVIGLLPRNEACAPLAEGGPAGSIFRQAGTPAIAISAGDGLCPVHGLIATKPGDFDGYPSQP